MATKKSKATEAVLEPVVTKGSHLTVTKYPDGRTELVWDHDALLRDVQEAIASVSKPNLVKVTEEKVAKSRAKKTEVTEKKPVAKKTPAKKKVSK